jgi:hypothetical protein
MISQTESVEKAHIIEVEEFALLSTGFLSLSAAELFVSYLSLTSLLLLAVPGAAKTTFLPLISHLSHLSHLSLPPFVSVLIFLVASETRQGGRMMIGVRADDY